MFGMHPNVEIGYLTSMSETLFDTILSVQGGSSAKDDIVMTALTDLRTRTPADHSLLDITAKIKEKTPAIVVCLQ
jgi:dynein heavy chain